MSAIDLILSACSPEQATAIAVLTPIITITAALVIGFAVQHVIAVRMLWRIGGRP